jgi:hypothetical protein
MRRLLPAWGCGSVPDNRFTWSAVRQIRDLIDKEADEYRRSEIRTAAASLKQGKRCGRVFEEQIAGTSTVLHYPIRPGALVR